MSLPENKDTPERSKAAWEYKERLRVQGEMAKVIRAAIVATKAELEVTRRKLRKMTYGA